jgi:hypothetical protein
MPPKKKARTRVHKAVAPLLGADPDLQAFHEPWRTHSDLGLALLAAALRHTVPLRVLWCDRWSLAAARVSMARSRTKDGLSVLKKPRHLETHSGVLQDAAGQPIRLEGPHMAVADLVPRIPPTAYREVPVGDTPSWTVPLAVRLPGLGTVRLVVRCQNVALPGPSAVLVRHRADGTVPRLLTRSRQRWPMATFAQDSQGPLGLDASRLRNAAARHKHWCLVCVASAFWPLDGLPSSPTQGSVPVKTIGEACRQHAQALLEGLLLEAHTCLELGQRAEDCFTSLCAKPSMVMAR